MLPLPPGRPAEPATLAERLRAGRPLLGALARDAAEAAVAVRAGLDLVVVPLAVPPPAELPVLVRITAAAEVPAVPPGAAGVLADVDSGEAARAIVAAAREGWVVLLRGAARVDGVDAVLADDGPARVVAGSGQARAALAAGATLVLYELSAVLDDLAADLSAVRPAIAPAPDRPALVLLSGMLGDATLWDGVASRLGDVLLPWPARIDLDDSVPAMAETVLAAAPPRFALAGHSLGAIVALEIARRAPDRLTALVLVNASARGPSEAQQAAWAQWRRRTLDGAFPAIAGELARATLAAGRRAEADLLAANEAMARTVGPEGFLRQLAAQATRPESRDGLAAIAVPTTVFSGEADEICPPALQRELADLCPAAELVTLPGGHMLPLECPTQLAEELRARLLP